MRRTVCVLTVCAFMFVIAAGYAFAAQYAVLGRLTPDAMVKKTGSTLTLVFTVENQTDKFWTPGSVTPVFQYKIFNAATGAAYRTGQLSYTLEQYVAPNGTCAFGVVNISLSGFPAGNYRILLFSSEFRNPVNADRLYIGGSTAIRVTP